MKKITILIIFLIIFFTGCTETKVIYVNETPVAKYQVKTTYHKPKVYHKTKSYIKKTKTRIKKSLNNYKRKTYSSSITEKPYFVRGKWYYPISTYKGKQFRGIASWYGPNFHGKLSANGEIYNMYHYTAANKILPLGTKVKVINLNNHKSVVVRINDRGPFVKGRIIDLSYIAGKKIGIDKTGTAPVKLIVLYVPKSSKYHTSSSKYHKNKTTHLTKNIKNYPTIKIQVGAFNSLKGAKLRKNKYKGFSTYIKHEDGVYRVYIGTFKTRDEAQNFKTKYGIHGFITN